MACVERASAGKRSLAQRVAMLMLPGARSPKEAQLAALFRCRVDGVDEEFVASNSIIRSFSHRKRGALRDGASLRETCTSPPSMKTSNTIVTSSMQVMNGESSISAR